MAARQHEVETKAPILALRLEDFKDKLQVCSWSRGLQATLWPWVGYQAVYRKMSAASTADSVPGIVSIADVADTRLTTGSAHQ
jgi:hypothetical protein